MVPQLAAFCPEFNAAKEPAHGAVVLCPAGYALDSGRG